MWSVSVSPPTRTTFPFSFALSPVTLTFVAPSGALMRSRPWDRSWNDSDLIDHHDRHFMGLLSLTWLDLIEYVTGCPTTAVAGASAVSDMEKSYSANCHTHACEYAPLTSLL